MIQVINRALDILELLSKEPSEPKSLGEIAFQLNLNASTCSHILKTLVDRNYVEKLEKQRGYKLGSMLESFSGFEGNKLKLMEAGKNELELLSKKVNENVIMAVLKEDKRVAILRVQSQHELQVIAADEKKAYESATGRLLIAMLEDELVEKFISRYGLPTEAEWSECSDKAGFLDQVKKIRELGIASQTSSRHIIGFAAPIFKEKDVIASLSVYMPTARFKKSQMTEIVKAMKITAKKISKNL